MRAPYQGCVPATGGQIPVVGLGIHYDALRSTFFGGQRRRSLGAVRSSPLDTRRDSMLYRTVPKPPAWPPPARPGDIAATLGLKHTFTGETLADDQVGTAICLCQRRIISLDGDIDWPILLIDIEYLGTSGHCYPQQRAHPLAV